MTKAHDYIKSPRRRNRHKVMTSLERWVKEQKRMTDRCSTCPYRNSTGCTFYVLCGNWYCARDDLEVQNEENHGEEENG